MVDGFAAWAHETGRPLYPHQEEALLALAAGEHVVLATPTGSGKSLAAVAGIVLARNRGERSVWTAPIKALVAEKFFDLAALLGAEHVGLATGDATGTPDAWVDVRGDSVLISLSPRAKWPITLAGIWRGAGSTTLISDRLPASISTVCANNLAGRSR